MPVVVFNGCLACQIPLLINILLQPYSTDMAEAAFYLCAYEFAIKTVNSPWCRLFDEVDAQVWASDI